MNMKSNYIIQFVLVTLFLISSIICIPTIYAIVDIDEMHDIIQNSKDITISLGISSTIEIIPEESNYNVNQINIRLNYIPVTDYRQQTLDQSFDPYPKTVNDSSAYFEWKNPSSKIISYSSNSIIKTEQEYKKIKNSISYPFVIPEKYIQFTKATTTIDSDNQDIKNLAAELSMNKNDLYDLVITIANWTNSNIVYDLSSLTAEVSQKSSWVLENKKGVCDELTTLFIALLRANNIPARFVSGIAFTNIETFDDPWGPHGWAEVYFPDIGWVPFDVTYGQYGYLDNGHITLQTLIDPTSYTVNYEWIGNGFTIKENEIKKEILITDFTPITNKPYSLKIQTIKEETGFDSYNLVQATFKNNYDYYIAFDAYLAETKDLAMITPQKQLIVLAPNEEAYYYWLIQVNDNLKAAYKYTFPIVVSTSHNIEASTSFDSYQDATRYEKISLQKFKKENNINSNLERNPYVYFACASEKETYSTNEKIRISCKIKNQHNDFSLSNIQICYKDDCQFIEHIIPDQEKLIEFETSFDTPRTQEISFSIKGDEIAKTSEVKLSIIDQAAISIQNITYPQTIKYDNNFDLTFMLQKDSFAPGKNAELFILINKIPSIWEINSVTKNRELTIHLDTTEFTTKDNEIEIILKYETEDEDLLETTEVINIQLLKPTFIELLRIRINDLERKFKLLFAKEN